MEDVKDNHDKYFEELLDKLNDEDFVSNNTEELNKLKNLLGKATEGKDNKGFTLPEAGSITLCEEQEEAVETILSEEHPVIILTGVAGSGKSTVVKHLLDKHSKKFRVCATTGMAAVIVGGSTVDSLFAFSRSSWTVRDANKQRRNMENCPKNIIIDEGSMIGLRMASIIMPAAETYKKNIILVGDWAQASPVKDYWPFKTKMFKEAKVIKLEENHRQSEGEFYTALNHLRVGDRNPEHYDCIRARGVDEFYGYDHTIFLTATNNVADHINSYRVNNFIQENDCEFHEMIPTLVDKRGDSMKKNFPINDWTRNKHIDSSRLANGILLAEGCRVVLTKNKDGSFVNGDTGTITTISTNSEDSLITSRSYCKLSEGNSSKDSRVNVIYVKLDRTGSEVAVIREVVDIVKEGNAGSSEANIDFSVIGFPIKLGYAITIHKSQGMTVPRMCVDVGSILSFPSDESRHGLAYVALSRVRNVEDLSLIGWNEAVISCSDEVKDFI